MSKTKVSKIIKDMGLFRSEDSNYDEYAVKWTNKKGLALKKKILKLLQDEKDTITKEREDAVRRFVEWKIKGITKKIMSSDAVIDKEYEVSYAKREQIKQVETYLKGDKVV